MSKHRQREAVRAAGHTNGDQGARLKSTNTAKRRVEFRER
jgi:hypothetical protein